MQNIVVVTLLFVCIAFAQTSSIEGVFRLPNGIDIEISQGDSALSGKIVNLNGYRALDSKNPEKSMRNDSLMGKIILPGLTYDDEKENWNGGKLYFTDKGITVNLTIESVSDEGLYAMGSKFVMRKRILFKRIR